MLQQTTVVAVIPYYEAWMAKFPTVDSVASASETDVMRAWQGLGYYNRARNIQNTARQVLQSGWPDSPSELKKLPGIGPYTAGAIASIAFNQSCPVVDGNIERVYSRLTADASTSSFRKSRAWAWAEKNLDQIRPGDWNQALMELGATICRPVKPLCPECPLSSHCKGYQAGTQNQFPPKRPRSPAKEIFLIAQVQPRLQDGRTVVQMRLSKKGEWWHGTYVFPTVSGRKEAETVGTIGTFNHTITNHKVHFSVQWVAPSADVNDLIEIPIDEIEKLPLSSAHRKILKILQSYLIDFK